jgi:putative redox protein
MADTKTRVTLRWTDGLAFEGEAGQAAIRLASSGDALSPMQALAAGLAGCMSIDVVSILEKGRQSITAIEIELSGERAEKPPRRFVSFAIHYRISGEVEPARVERAIALSRETYCSVWHSLRTDISLETSFEIVDAASTVDSSR